MGDSDPDKEKASFSVWRMLYTGRRAPVSSPVCGQECLHLTELESSEPPAWLLPRSGWERRPWFVEHL